jgi:hypothetical protein
MRRSGRMKITCPVGLSPVGPLVAAKSKPASPTPLRNVPVPMTESCSGWAGGLGAAAEADGVANSPRARTPTSVPRRTAARVMERMPYLHLLVDETD